MYGSVEFNPAIQSIFKVNHGYNQYPINFNAKPSSIFQLKQLQADVFERTTPKTHLSAEDVRQLFKNGLEKNSLYKEIEKFIKTELENSKDAINLSTELTEQDIKVIRDLMNINNGKYIDVWKGKSDTDNIPNLQKLALFARTMQLSKLNRNLFNVDEAKWDLIVESVIKKPQRVIRPLLKYKENSTEINNALSSKTPPPPEVQEMIDAITAYLNLFETKKDMVNYRGEQTFNILQFVDNNEKNINLKEIIEDYTKLFRNDYLNNNFNEKYVKEVVDKYIIEQKITQPRFMSTAMLEECTAPYAEKILWILKVPKGTRGASIESFNVERKGEAEFLAQRGGKFVIKNATYNPKKDLWIFNGYIKQSEIDKDIMNAKL